MCNGMIATTWDSVLANYPTGVAEFRDSEKCDQPDSDWIKALSV